MTELVITDPKFLRAFEGECDVAADGIKIFGVCGDRWYGKYFGHNKKNYNGSLKALTDDEYIWVMLRAMEEGLI